MKKKPQSGIKHVRRVTPSGREVKMKKTQPVGRMTRKVSFKLFEYTKEEYTSSQPLQEKQVSVGKIDWLRILVKLIILFICAMLKGSICQ
jgi:hypothetical protein